jgi:PEP-CTERM motif
MTNICVRWRGNAMGLVMAVTTPWAAAATTELVILQSNVSARLDSLLRNRDLVAASPFDGVVINMPATYTAMLNSTQLDYNSVFGYWLQPMVGTIPKLKDSYLRIDLRDSGDPFGNWDNALNNWSIMARAAKDAGMRGIYFDNEAYSEPGAFTFPGNANNPALGLAAYQERFRQRGADVMNAVQSVWSNAEIVSLHGPYVSEPTTPAAVRLEQVGASGNDMRGFFFAGMLASKGANTRVTDGGELYQARAQSDFDIATQWRRSGMPQVPGSKVVPPSLRDSWANKISLSYGVYDQQWRPNYPMTPALFEEALFQAFMHADSPVWVYTDNNDYLVPGGVDAVWLTAISNAKARAVIAQVPEPTTWAMWLAGVGALLLWTRKRGKDR